MYLEIPENLMCLLLKDRFWFVHIPFGSMIKFQSLAQFPADHLLDPVVYNLLCKFATFVYYVINRFISFSALLKLSILLCIIDYPSTVIVILLQLLLQLLLFFILKQKEYLLFFNSKIKINNVSFFSTATSMLYWTSFTGILTNRKILIFLNLDALYLLIYLFCRPF